MADTLPYVRHGRGAARPYVHAHADAVELCKAAFDAEVIVEAMRGPHVELGIADSVIVIEVGETFPATPARARSTSMCRTSTPPTSARRCGATASRRPRTTSLTRNARPA